MHFMKRPICISYPLYFALSARRGNMVIVDYDVRTPPVLLLRLFFALNSVPIYHEVRFVHNIVLPTDISSASS